ncbi:MAG: MlaD family protein, partial [Verrucomicrobiota bacterium]
MERRIPTRSVGVFITVALTTVAVLILNFSKGAGVFSRRYRIYVEAVNVGGMKKGAPVSVSGVPVGHVDDIRLTEDGLRVLLDCRLSPQFKVYSNSVFEIEQSGFLGDQFVAIIPTKNAAPALQDGAEVVAVDPFNLQEAARSAVGLMTRLDQVVERV